MNVPVVSLGRTWSDFKMAVCPWMKESRIFCNTFAILIVIGNDKNIFVHIYVYLSCQSDT